MKEFTVEDYQFLQTFCGHCITYPDIKPEQIDIRDIAHSHSIMARYNGHGKVAFSVGAHCLAGVELCQRLADKAKPEYSQTLGNPEFIKDLKRAFLLHDASECYILDFPRPMKAYFNTLGFGQIHQALEDRIFDVIALKYDIKRTEAIKEWVDTLDDLTGMAEGQVLYENKKLGGWIEGGVDEDAATTVSFYATLKQPDIEELFLLVAEELGVV